MCERRQFRVPRISGWACRWIRLEAIPVSSRRRCSGFCRIVSSARRCEEREECGRGALNAPDVMRGLMPGSQFGIISPLASQIVRSKVAKRGKLLDDAPDHPLRGTFAPTRPVFAHGRKIRPEVIGAAIETKARVSCLYDQSSWYCADSWLRMLAWL